MPPQEKTQTTGHRIDSVGSDGTPYDHLTIRSVWEKATRQPGFETFSLDHKGTTINMFEYGRRSAYGWVIERVVPVSQGGTDDLANLVPVHWKHARSIPNTPGPPKNP